MQVVLAMFRPDIQRTGDVAGPAEAARPDPLPAGAAELDLDVE